MLDDEGRAEVMALARKMLNPGSKNAIIESAYNRYAFHDGDDMPIWFRDYES